MSLTRRLIAGSSSATARSDPVAERSERAFHGRLTPDTNLRKRRWRLRPFERQPRQNRYEPGLFHVYARHSIGPAKSRRGLFARAGPGAAARPGVHDFRPRRLRADDAQPGKGRRAHPSGRSSGSAELVARDPRRVLLEADDGDRTRDPRQWRLRNVVNDNDD